MAGGHGSANSGLAGEQRLTGKKKSGLRKVSFIVVGGHGVMRWDWGGRTVGFVNATFTSSIKSLIFSKSVL
jgi:hypothetical protein